MAEETETIQVRATVERKQEDLPAFVVIPAEAVAPWGLTGTATVHLSVDGHDAGRRSLKRWDDARWFVDLTRAFLDEAGIGVGDRVRVAIRRASEELPDELRVLLEESSAAQTAWEGLTDSRRRAVREHVLAARRSATRSRRAWRMLGLDG